jgi:hypothetical protein
MSPAKRAFRLVFLICVALGVLAWLVNLVAPGAVAITYNGAPATGIAAILVPVILGVVFGLILGLIVAGITALFTRSSARG